MVNGGERQASRAGYREEHDGAQDLRTRARSVPCDRAPFLRDGGAPHAAEWERNGITAREPWLRAGELGLLGWEAPEKFGGQDVKDFRYNAIMTEEMQEHRHGRHRDRPAKRHHGLLPGRPDHRRSRRRGGFRLTSAVRSSRRSRCPKPGAGSDLAGIRTTAVRDGDHSWSTGPKTPISNGILANSGVAVVKTPAGRSHGHLAAGNRARHGGLRARPQPGQDRPEGGRHRRTVLHRRARAGGEPPRRGEPRLLSTDAQLARQRLGIAIHAVAQSPRVPWSWTQAVRRGAQGVRQPDRPPSRSTGGTRSRR